MMPARVLVRALAFVVGAVFLRTMIYDMEMEMTAPTFGTNQAKVDEVQALNSTKSKVNGNATHSKAKVNSKATPLSAAEAAYISKVKAALAAARAAASDNSKSLQSASPASDTTPTKATASNNTNQQQLSAKRIPSIMIAGTQKASTTSIANYMMYELQFCFPQDRGFDGSHKETHFFDWDHQYKQGLPFYQDLYQHCLPDHHLVEATPETMLFPDRVHKIYEEANMADKVKFIFILREPVSREVSWYNHRLRYAEKDEKPPSWTHGIMKPEGGFKSFWETMDATVANVMEHEEFHRKEYYLYGVYVHWLERWIKLFHRSQMLILSYDELKNNPQVILERIHRYLELPIKPTTKLELGRDNAASKSRQPPPCEDQLKMHTLFEPYNQQLYQWMEDNPGPVMEERPFPKFGVPCVLGEQQ